MRPSGAPDEAPRQRRSVRRIVRPSLLLGAAIVLGFLFIAVAAPLLAPAEGDALGAVPRDGFGPDPEPPGPGHPLGLTSGKYDVYYGLIWGTRSALRIALAVVLGRVLVGLPVGLLAGTYGKLTDSSLMRLTDAFLAFPIAAVLMVALVALPLPQEPIVVLVFIAFGWMSYARLVRGNLLVEREKEYVQAAHATGVRHRRLIVRHLFPNATHGLFVLMASDMGAVVLLVAAFTFIGLISAGYEDLVGPNWAQMLSASRNWIIGAPDRAFQYWYTYLPVSAAIILFSIGWNLLGDGLRDALDPRLR